MLLAGLVLGVRGEEWVVRASEGPLWSFILVDFKWASQIPRTHGKVPHG